MVHHAPTRQVTFSLPRSLPSPVSNFATKLRHPVRSARKYYGILCAAGLWGTVWLASSQLVSGKDAIFNVFLRYALSAILCRLVLITELGGMRRIAP